MKFLIILLAVFTIVHSEFTKEQEEKWQEFKIKHGKMFLSPGKENDRKKTFLKNVEDVEKHNEAFLNGETTYTKDIYEHSDLSEEAFIAKFGGINMEAAVRTIDSDEVVLRQTPPASLDLRTHAGVGPVRNQRSCGSCWIFSTVSAVEYAYWRSSGIALDLAEQELVDCVYGTEKSGCKGGWMPEAMQYIGNNSISLETDYPYTATWGTCQGPSKPKTAVKLNPKRPCRRPANSDDTSIKNALNTYGVLSVCVSVKGWSQYGSGIFYSNNYTSPICNHAVGLVGYGTEGGIPYWIIRNSWGPNWAENGYMRLDARRDAQNFTYGGIMLGNAFYAQIV